MTDPLEALDPDRDDRSGVVGFDELDISGYDSSTVLVALVEHPEARWLLALALLVDAEKSWAVYSTDLAGAKSLRRSLDSRIAELEESLRRSGGNL